MAAAGFCAATMARARGPRLSEGCGPSLLVEGVGPVRVRGVGQLPQCKVPDVPKTERERERERERVWEGE